jgi:hypothetical protein
MEQFGRFRQSERGLGHTPLVAFPQKTIRVSAGQKPDTFSFLSVSFIPVNVGRWGRPSLISLNWKQLFTPYSGSHFSGNLDFNGDPSPPQIWPTEILMGGAGARQPLVREAGLRMATAEI